MPYRTRWSIGQKSVVPFWATTANWQPFLPAGCWQKASSQGLIFQICSENGRYSGSAAEPYQVKSSYDNNPF